MPAHALDEGLLEGGPRRCRHGPGVLSGRAGQRGHASSQLALFTRQGWHRRASPTHPVLDTHLSAVARCGLAAHSSERARCFMVAADLLRAVDSGPSAGQDHTHSRRSTNQSEPVDSRRRRLEPMRFSPSEVASHFSLFRKAVEIRAWSSSMPGPHRTRLPSSSNPVK